MDITRTIQATEDPSWVAQLFDGSIQEAWFPLPCVPKNADRGDWLYVIYRGEVFGRLRINKKERRNQKPDPVGSQGHTIDARCRVHVEVPGELTPSAKKPLIVRGRMGFRYTPPLW